MSAFASEKINVDVHADADIVQIACTVPWVAVDQYLILF